MVPTYFETVASSNDDDKDGLSNPTDPAWTSTPQETTPTLESTIAEENTFIKVVEFKTQNVNKVTVTVYDEDGEPVSLYLLITIEIILDFYLISGCDGI